MLVLHVLKRASGPQRLLAARSLIILVPRHHVSAFEGTCGRVRTQCTTPYTIYFEAVINLGLYPAVWGSSRAISAVETPMRPHEASCGPHEAHGGGCAGARHRYLKGAGWVHVQLPEGE